MYFYHLFAIKLNCLLITKTNYVLILTENALRKTRHWMIPSMVSPVRQNVPVKWRPLRPTAEAVIEAKLVADTKGRPVGTRSIRSKDESILTTLSSHGRTQYTTITAHSSHFPTSLAHYLFCYLLCTQCIAHSGSIHTTALLCYVSMFALVITKCISLFRLRQNKNCVSFCL